MIQLAHLHALRCTSPPPPHPSSLAGGVPLVVSSPSSPTAAVYMELGAAVVREVAKVTAARGGAGAGGGLPQVVYDVGQNAVVVRLPGKPEFALHPATVRRNDTSARSVNEWSGQRMLRDEDVPDTVVPASIKPVGNYAVQIKWQDGLSQVAPYELLDSLRGKAIPWVEGVAAGPVTASIGGVQVQADLS